MADEGEVYCPKHLRVQRRKALAQQEPIVSDIVAVLRAGTHRLELRPCVDGTAVACLAPVQRGNRV